MDASQHSTYSPAKRAIALSSVLNMLDVKDLPYREICSNQFDFGKREIQFDNTFSTDEGIQISFALQYLNPAELPNTLIKIDSRGYYTSDKEEHGIFVFSLAPSGALALISRLSDWSHDAEIFIEGEEKLTVLLDTSISTLFRKLTAELSDRKQQVNLGNEHLPDTLRLIEKEIESPGTPTSAKLTLEPTDRDPDIARVDRLLAALDLAKEDGKIDTILSFSFEIKEFYKQQFNDLKLNPTACFDIFKAVGATALPAILSTSLFMYPQAGQFLSLGLALSAVLLYRNTPRVERALSFLRGQRPDSSPFHWLKYADKDELLEKNQTPYIRKLTQGIRSRGFKPVLCFGEDSSDVKIVIHPNDPKLENDRGFLISSALLRIFNPRKF